MKRILLYTTLVMLCACDKQLSEPPANARVEGTAITDQKTANTALNGVYYRFANVTVNNITLWSAHHLPGGMLTGMLGYGLGSVADERNDNVNAGYPAQAWGESYLLLNAANGLIDAVNTVPDQAFTGARKNEILGESRFLRAYGHFKLLMFFSEWNNAASENGVLLRDKFVTLSGIQKRRSTVKETYDFILSDLDYAIANAPATNQKYYATRWAAMVLKMRLLLNRAQPADYPEVVKLADMVLLRSPYVLENNLKDIFYAKGLTSSEVILGVQPQPNQAAYYYIQSRAYYPAQSSLFVATKAFKDLLGADPRATWMVGPTTPYQAYSPNTYYFTKYIAYGTATTQLTETSYAMRLSEVYLLKAEALIRSGGSLADAKTLIKTVMGKAGATDFSAVDNANTPADLLLQNYYEVLRNLTGEDCIEWMALMRLPFEQVKVIRPTITLAQQYYFPVPQTEFDLNPLFGKQNTGYGL
ncbi:RagB/SusD family nutrient uptake outer membrane protein [Chitinophaga sedimenti]|uniref:RagB/SusD family nutrient uptake outer membrane protein n=1 Tax=Chitinophaga sedimenti TaxID=2033606 RepID=UPI0020050DD2|nr:RagB/SusD family nutrient uptake outer membrane protein [Chitinophaga sedimenti]MCK7555650.1 RagB/SusD family nutrient uptake outer membrane protein [Chitinophaga sedimenti]